jgi:ribosomal protein S18 acetylase RimI-like enzyme
MPEIRIRNASMADVDAVAELESTCFPPSEAASRSRIAHRLEVFPECFWLLTEDGCLVSAVDGCCSDEEMLQDGMYEEASLHRPDGRWQMLFGVMTRPEKQGQGFMHRLMERVLEDCRKRGKAGIVLTCKPEKISFYRQFGFVDEGRSASCHGQALWHQMRLWL